MGGAVVQRFAASFPHRVSALVLAAAVTGDERVGRSVAHIAPWLMPALPLLAGAAARGLLSRAFSHGSGPSSTVREAYLRPVRIRGSMDGLVAMINDGAGRDTPIDRSRITMPVLLLYGADDRVVPVSARRRLQEMLPQARMVIIERAGHLLLEERPEDCVAAIERCLAEGSTSALAPAGSVVSGRRV
jgi:pimeloyl-ACP methyl ester carboxylesterase